MQVGMRRDRRCKWKEPFARRGPAALSGKRGRPFKEERSVPARLKQQNLRPGVESEILKRRPRTLSRDLMRSAHSFNHQVTKNHSHQARSTALSKMKMKKYLAWIALYAMLITNALAGEQPLITNVPNRTGVSLDGEWHYIIDPYQNGFFDYRRRPHDAACHPGSRRLFHE